MMVNSSSRFWRYALFSHLCVLLILLGTVTAEGATYYVSTTGSDSNPGTSASPWRNPQKCAASPIRAGDTCIVRNGTYTDSRGNGIVVYVSASSAAGTASQPITIKSENPRGAVIKIPSAINGTNRGFYVTRPYYIIQGFDITGGTNNGSSVGFIGISFQSTATGGTARLNSIHHIGRTVCSNSTYGFAGVYVSRTSGVVLENNRIYSIGRKRNGEGGCSTSRFQNDHGIYLSGGSNITIRRNVFYDTNRGYPIHAYGGTVSNLNIYHNTLSGKSPTGKPVGQILLGSTIAGAFIKNNVSSDAQTGMIQAWGLSGSNISITHNLSDTLVKSTSSVPGATISSNLERLNPAFISKSTYDFRLTSSSPAINRGTRSGVPLVPDGSPDMSAHEYGVQSISASPLTPTGLTAQ